MFTRNDEQYLLRAISANRCVLFLGAGFSSLANNRNGDSMPSGRQLAAAISRLLGYDATHDESPLTDLFEVLITSGLPRSKINQFLEQQLLCSDVPAVYDAITLPFWNRIYTTNADDLLPIVYRRAASIRLKCLSYPDDYTTERDQALNELQAIYLNGRLPCDPAKLTFSFLQYAGAAGQHLPFYDQFVSDYATHPTVIVGTQLNEPLLWRYIQSRQSKDSHLSERRPRSFLIDPAIQGPRADALRQFNVVPIQRSVDDFLQWIRQVERQLPSRLEVLKSTLPGVVELLAGSSERSRKDVEQFAIYFEQVPALITFPKERSAFLLGATPRWTDIGRDLDAPRDIGQQLASTIRTKMDATVQHPIVYLITGSAGCGKSTVLRRLALTLAREGHPSFLSNSEELPQHRAVIETLESLAKTAVLLFDNAEVSLGAIASLARALETSKRPPIIVLATRTNEYRRRIRGFGDLKEVHEVIVPHLSRNEINSVLLILETNGLLGRLRGMTKDQRIEEFERRSAKQILVAMREATSGHLFDDIIRDEFVSLPSEEAKILYLAVALATDAGYRLPMGDFVGCSEVSPADTLDLVETILRDIVIRTGHDGDLLVLRHRRIAEYMVDSGASRFPLKVAYIRLVTVLAGKVQGAKWTSAQFKLYRTLINHFTISQRFAENPDQAREIYDSLAPSLPRDTQFWLQYGSLELQVDNLDLAENYLNQADSLDEGNAYVRNALDHLAYRRGILADSRAAAESYYASARERLGKSMDDSSVDEPHCFHITLTQELRWILKWVTEKADQARYLNSLREIAVRAKLQFPNDRQIENAADDVERHYLMVATS
jgi:ABC-type dipeptide/oligopeptide/nickel transport system ATPase subunit